MNSLFDDLKKIKKEMSAEEKKENERKSKEIKEKKEEKMKNDFLAFIGENNIKKI